MSRKLPPGIREHRGRYQVRYYDQTGKRVAQSFDRLSDAKKFKRGVDTDRDRGQLLDRRKAKTPFGKVANEVMESKLNLRPATRARDMSLLRTHVLPAFENTAIGDIDRQSVQAWVRSLADSDLKPRTVREAHRILSGIMKEAVLSKYVLESPCQKIALPRVDRVEKRFLSATEVAQLVEAFDDDHHALIHSASYLGMRWEELAGLKRANLDVLRRTLRVVGVIERAAGTYNYVEMPKTDASRRTLRIPDFLVDIIARHLERAPDSEFVFPAPGGGHLRYDNFRRRVWNPAVKRAGLDGLTFHALRHTAAALAIDGGADPLQVQRRLGHADVRITLGLYGHLFPNREDDLNDTLEDAFLSAQSGSKGDQTGTSVVPLRETGTENTL